jgi:adenine-specific DNA-methyltransferase
MSRHQKLELTWIDKEQQPRLEPRILLENQENSHHSATMNPGDIFDNILIHGDNLLALKALESDFSGRVKCVYIDPPFNTQQAFDDYDDGIEHSAWLSLMRDRLVILHKLLRDDGSLFIHIDDNELGYLIALTDEVFGRKNRIGVITFKQSSVSGPKAINPGLVTTANYILYYVKDKQTWKPNRVFVPRKRDSRYNTFIIGRDRDLSEWQLIPLKDAFNDHLLKRGRSSEKLVGDRYETALENFVLENADAVARLARVDAADVSEEGRKALGASQGAPGQVFRALRQGRSDLYFMNGEQLIFYSSKTKTIDGKLTTAEALSNIWDDLLSNNVHKEGQVRLPNGKKPEALIKRILELETAPGDLVLDSFAGSGTTAATAHKMGRRWITVELRDQCETQVLPRLKRVVDGTDLDGITKAVGWKGGGGFRFYRLAPSLLEKDRWGNWVISKEYNPTMLAEAVCKHMGFTYAPSQDLAEYWNHGHSSERDFIFVTTNALTHKMLEAISYDVGPDRHLLVCCKAFSTERADAFENLTLRKIPHAVLNTCEWGRADYSLRIASLPIVDRNGPEDEEPSARPKRKRSKGERQDEPTLFGETAEVEG